MFPPSSADAGAASSSPWLLSTLDREFAFFEHLLRYGKNQSSCTIANHRVAYKNLRMFLNATVGEARELPTTFFDPLAWLAWNRMQTKPPAEASIHTYWSKNRTFFRFLVEKHAMADPFANAKAPTLPTRVPKARTPVECARILDAAEHGNWPSTFERKRAVAMLAIILFAGLRRKEVLQLKRMHVDFDQQTINVEKGKGRGGGKQRITFIAPELDRILRQYVQLRDQIRNAPPEFFCSRQNSKPVSEMTFRRIMRDVRASSGVPFTLHSLRHSFITQLLRSGVPLHTVSDLAGHTQLTTTAGYLRVWDDDKRRALTGFTYT
jgi:integrase/recombinase XerC/integrase/recombinase XerD